MPLKRYAPPTRPFSFEDVLVKLLNTPPTAKAQQEDTVVETLVEEPEKIAEPTLEHSDEISSAHEE